MQIVTLSQLHVVHAEAFRNGLFLMCYIMFLLFVS